MASLHTSTIVDLPSEIRMCIFQYLAPTLLASKLKPSEYNKLNYCLKKQIIYREFQEFKEFLLISKKLFYDVLICDCEHYDPIIEMWKRINSICKYFDSIVDRFMFKETSSIIMGECVHEQIRNVFNVMNSGKTFIQFSYLHIYFSELIRDENALVKLETFRIQVKRMPSLRLDCKNLSILLKELVSTIRPSFGENEIGIVYELFNVIFEEEFTREISLKNEIKELSYVLSFIVSTSDSKQLFERIFNHTITNNEMLDLNQKSEKILGLLLTVNPYPNYSGYCLMDSIIATRKWEVLEKLVSMVTVCNGRDIVQFMDTIISIYDDRSLFLESEKYFTCLESLVKMLFNLVDQPISHWQILTIISKLALLIGSRRLNKNTSLLPGSFYDLLFDSRLNKDASLLLDSFPKFYDLLFASSTKAIMEGEEEKCMVNIISCLIKYREIIELMLERDAFQKGLDENCANGKLYVTILNEIIEYNPKHKCYAMQPDVKYIHFEVKMDNLQNIIGSQRMVNDIEMNGFKTLVESILEQCKSYKETHLLKVTTSKIIKYLNKLIN